MPSPVASALQVFSVARCEGEEAKFVIAGVYKDFFRLVKFKIVILLFRSR